jgi:radical SAM superfamily enzyme YgiQ (UPF0313 family)
MQTEFPLNRRPDLTSIEEFKTHDGCSSSCVYCPDANTGVSFRNIKDVIADIKSLTEKGHEDFVAADSEFNEDLEYALEFCESLKKTGLKIKWSVFMKPANYNQKLLRLMKNTGVDLIRLKIDSFKKCPLYWTDTEKLVFIAKSCGLRIQIDFVTGFPYEDEELPTWCLDLFRRIQPDKVNINTFIRLYKSSQLARIIKNDPELKKNLIGNTEDPEFKEPVFYNRIGIEELIKLIDNDRLFTVVRFDPSVLSQ